MEKALQVVRTGTRREIETEAESARANLAMVERLRRLRRRTRACMLLLSGPFEYLLLLIC